MIIGRHYIAMRVHILIESIIIDASIIKPQVTWGTSPEMVVDINGSTPDPEKENDQVKAESIRNALKYIHLEPNTSIKFSCY